MMRRVALAMCFVAGAAQAQDFATIQSQGGCPDCDLRLAGLRGLAIDGADFSDARLIEADLKAVTLPDANFADANMQSWHPAASPPSGPGGRPLAPSIKRER